MADLPIETIRVGMLADAHGGDVAGVRAILMRQQAMGWLRIVTMDDEMAIVQWTNTRMAKILSGAPEVGDE